MTFGSLARRLTAWYVFVAVVLVVLLTGSIIVAALMFYARDANEQIGAFARQVPDIEARALSDHDDWEAARTLLLRRLARPGLTVLALPPPGGRAFGRPPDGMPQRPFEPPARDSAASRPFDSPESLRREASLSGRRPGGRGVRFEDRPLFSNRFGFIAASSLGIRVARRPFLGGFAIVFVDIDRVRTIVAISLGVLVATGSLAALVAWAIGRYITSQALRPLYDVTSALVRFAGRDFSAQSIDVAGRSEFDALVRAYNAAADQVASAFAERAAAEAQMRQFVADAGHELRTPLTIVLGYIDMLKRRAPIDERSRRIFETIALEGTRMRTLIDNLILLARLEGEDVRPIEPFDLTPLLQDDIVRTRQGVSPQVRIDLNVAADATIIGDRTEIHEAIANLVDNAIKYARGSPIEIGVARAGSDVEVTVTDHGPGIAQADRAFIFDRFYRGALRVDVEGSGLGLPIAKRAIERAGGSLTLGATSQDGTTFRVRLRADRVRDRTPDSARAVNTVDLRAR